MIFRCTNFAMAQTREEESKKDEEEGDKEEENTVWIRGPSV